MNLMPWLNEYAPAISALAALISSVATLAIAALTYGTWKLYQLERARASESRLTFARAVFRVWKEAEASNAFMRSRAIVQVSDIGFGVRAATEQSLNDAIRRIEDLLSTATTGHLEVIAHLEAARGAFITARPLFGRGLNAAAEESSIPLRMRLARLAIEGGIANCRQAYASLPADEKHDSGGRSFAAMIDAARRSWSDRVGDEIQRLEEQAEEVL